MAEGRIKLRHLECFVAVARLRNLRKAAERLSITQPAVSKTLKELEDTLGARLFERARSGSTLTAQGEVFLRHASESLAALQAGVRSLEQARARGPARVAIGALPTVAPSFVPAAVLAFRRAMPGAVVRVQTGANAQLLSQLKAGELDLVLGRLSDPEPMAGLSFEHLYTDPLALVVRPDHPLLARRAPAAADLAAFPAVLPVSGTSIRQTADSFIAASGLPPPSDCLETLSVSVAREFARRSDAVWFVPLGAVERDLEDGTLRRLPIPTSGAEDPVVLVVRSDAQPGAAVQALIAALRAEAQRRREARTSAGRKPRRAARAAAAPLRSSPAPKP